MRVQREDGTASRKRRGQSGHSFMETALVLLPFLSLFFALFDFGMAIFVRNTFQHAVREGVRYAVTYQTANASTGHDASIKQVVQQQALGFLNGPANLDKIKIRYYSPETLAEVPGNAPGNVVEVSVEGYEWGMITPLLGNLNPIPLTVRASDKMESLPGGVNPPAR